MARAGLALYNRAVPTNERRQAIRYPIEVSVTLAAAGVVQKTVTHDVSYNGIFAQTATPPTISQLTRIQIELPGSGVRFETHAMNVFVLEPGNEHDRPPGCGLKFYAMTEPNRQAWNRFVDAVRARQTSARPATGPRRRVRFRTRVELRPESRAELETLCREALASGVLQVSFHKPIEIGEPLRLDLVHPDSRDVIKLDGVARALRDEHPGVEVELEDFGDKRRAALVEFLS